MKCIQSWLKRPWRRRAISVPVKGIELMVRAPDQSDYTFIEANERPGLANHAPHGRMVHRPAVPAVGARRQLNPCQERSRPL